MLIEFWHLGRILFWGRHNLILRLAWSYCTVGPRPWQLLYSFLWLQIEDFGKILFWGHYRFNPSSDPWEKLVTKHYLLLWPQRDLTQVLVCHLQKGVGRPLTEPVNGRTVHKRRVHTDTVPGEIKGRYNSC